MAQRTLRCDDSPVKLGTTLDPDYRLWLKQLALDLAFHGMLRGRLEYLHEGLFPRSGRAEADVVVKWGWRRVPFQEVRRIYEWDVESILRSGGGHLLTLDAGFAEIKAVPSELSGPTEIDPELARRMPDQSLTPPEAWRLAPLAAMSSALVKLVLQGPVFRRLCEGVEVPPAPLRRNLETEPRLIGPDGVVRWNKASLLSDAEMNALGVEFANRAYTLLLGVAEGRIGIAPTGPRQDQFTPGLLPS